DEIRSYIGMESELQECCDPCEQGSVRRHAQANMDADAISLDKEHIKSTRYPNPASPPLFPAPMLRLEFGQPDLVTERADDPNFDGIVGSSSLGLPPLPLENKALINGGTDVEIFRFAEHGERVWVRSRYKDIYERESSKGTMLFII